MWKRFAHIEFTKVYRVRVLNALALLNEQVGNLQQALGFLKESEELFDDGMKLQHPEHYAVMLLELVRVYNNSKDQGNTAKYVELAEKVARSVPERLMFHLVTVLDHKSRIMNGLQRYQECIAATEEGLRLIESKRMKNGEI